MGSFAWRPGATEAIAELAAERYHATATPIILAAMVAGAPKRTGRLKSRHRAELIRDARGRKIRFTAQTGYGLPVHQGRRGFRARPGKTLRFVTKEGAVVFTKSVGPAKPNPWMVRAMKRAGVRNVRWNR